MMAIRSVHSASFGRCWLILIPATFVSISLYGPPFLWPTLRSHRSMVLGPPLIHRRMHERLRSLSWPAARASGSIHPDRPAPRTPAALNLIHSRRERRKALEGGMKSSLVDRSFSPLPRRGDGR